MLKIPDYEWGRGAGGEGGGDTQALLTQHLLCYLTIQGPRTDIV